MYFLLKTYSNNFHTDTKTYEENYKFKKMVKLPPQHINWGQLSRAKTKDLNLKEGAQDMFNPGMIIETNEADDDKYLQEF